MKHFMHYLVKHLCHLDLHKNNISCQGKCLILRTETLTPNLTFHSLCVKLEISICAFIPLYHMQLRNQVTIRFSSLHAIHNLNKYVCAIELLQLGIDVTYYINIVVCETLFL